MRDRSPLRAIPAEVMNHRQEISIPRPPAMLLETLARAKRYCAATAELLEDAQTGVRRGYQKSYTAWFGSPPEHPNPEMFTSFDRVLWIGAFCVMVFECLCAAVLTSMTLAVPKVAAVLVGVALTAVFTLTMKAVWHLHVAPDEVQPRRALATLYRWLMPLFAAWAVALIVALLLPRLVDQSTPVMNICFNIVMSVLTVLSPALSGLLFTAANLYGWARERTRDHHRLLTLRRDVEALSEECERTTPPGNAQPVQIVKHRDSTESLRHAGTTALSLLLAGLLIATSANAQKRGEFWLDDSRSPSIQDLNSAEDQFFKTLPAAMDGAGARYWEFFRFSRNAANARPVVTLETSPFVMPTCAPPVQTDELTKLFQRPQMAAKRVGEKRCAELRAAGQDKYARELSDQVTKVREAFDAAPRARGNCTALLDLMNRLVNAPPRQAPNLVVIVSDAIESCASVHGIRLAQPKAQMRALMVIVPSVEGGRQLTPWQEFELRKKSWRETAPWLEVLSIPLLTGAVFTPDQAKN